MQKFYWSCSQNIQSYVAYEWKHSPLFLIKEWYGKKSKTPEPQDKTFQFADVQKWETQAIASCDI